MSHTPTTTLEVSATDSTSADPRQGGLRRAAAIWVALIAVVMGLIGSAPAQAAGTGRVEIVNAWSGLRADVMWASTAQMQGVFLWPNNTSLSQEFTLLDSGNGFFRIQAAHSGQCLMLDWRGGTYVNGTPVIQHSYCGAGYTPSEWSRRYIRRAGCAPMTFCSNVMVLVNRRTGRCLDARSGAARPGAQAVLQQWDCITSSTAWNANNQVWDIRSLDPVILH